MKKQYSEVYSVDLIYNCLTDSRESFDSFLISNYHIKIILVDNHSTDDYYDRLKSIFPKLIFINSERNLGYAGGVNLGIR